MKRKRVLGIILLAAVLFLPTKAFAGDLSVKRIAGNDRFETSVEISKELYEKADSVVIALGFNFPDALVGGTLAVQLDIPTLLVRHDSIDPVVEEEIERLGAKKAFLLGGEAAVGKKVEEKLRDMGLTIDRIQGDNRFETAEKINEKRFELRENPQEDDTMGDAPYYANAYNFPDALAIAPLCGVTNELLYLIDNKTDAAPGVAVGGPKAITHSYDKDPSIENEWKYDEEGELISRPYRIFGINRYETAIAVAHQYFEYFGYEPVTVIVADGNNYPDALTAANLAANKSGAICLTETGKLPFILKAYLEIFPADNVIIVGGEKAVSENVQKELEEIQKDENDIDDGAVG